MVVSRIITSTNLEWFFHEVLTGDGTNKVVISVWNRNLCRHSTIGLFSKKKQKVEQKA
jgi:hypothetical protein